MDQQFAVAAAKVTDRCLRQDSLELSAIDAIVAAPARRGYRAALATHLGVPVERITVADDEGTHTACFAAAFDRAARQVPSGGHILLVAAGAGITAGAAMYRQP